ncbi:MAG: hypothetical protein FJY67_05240 [Calditrichaeota bacterium]|nr:hypothetical protein [Calditrichota bacterium]
MIGFLLASEDEWWRVGGNLQSVRPPMLAFSFPEMASSDGSNSTLKPNVGVQASGNYGDYYRPGGMESEGASFRRRIDASVALWGVRPVPWQVRFGESTRTMRLDLTSKRHAQSSGLNLNQRRLHVMGRLHTGKAELSFGMQTGSGRGPELQVAGGVIGHRRGSLAMVYRQIRIDSELGAIWHQESALVKPVISVEESRGYLASPDSALLQVEVSMKRASWLRRRVDSGEALLEPWGNSYGISGLISFGDAVWRVAVGGRGERLRLQAYGMKGEYPFAKLTRADLDLWSGFVSAMREDRIRKRMTLVEAERLSWDGIARGHVEFWPFTSGFVDLLGLRRYFISRTSGFLYRLHAGHSRYITPDWEISWGANALDVHPQWKAEHWKPAYLVFGKADEQHYTWNVERVLGGIVHVSLRFAFSGWRVESSLAQAFPIKVWRRTTPSTEPPEPEAVRRSPTYGGGFGSLTLSRRF